VPDQLIHALFGNRAASLGVDVNAVRGARRLPVDAHTKSHRSLSRGRPHHEMKVAGMKPI